MNNKHLAVLERAQQQMNFATQFIDTHHRAMNAAQQDKYLAALRGLEILVADLKAEASDEQQA